MDIPLLIGSPVKEPACSRAGLGAGLYCPAESSSGVPDMRWSLQNSLSCRSRWNFVREKCLRSKGTDRYRITWVVVARRRSVALEFGRHRVEQERVDGHLLRRKAELVRTESCDRRRVTGYGELGR